MTKINGYTIKMIQDKIDDLRPSTSSKRHGLLSSQESRAVDDEYCAWYAAKYEFENYLRGFWINDNDPTADPNEYVSAFDPAQLRRVEDAINAAKKMQS
jgi:hypothetical protein